MLGTNHLTFCLGEKPNGTHRQTEGPTDKTQHYTSKNDSQDYTCIDGIPWSAGATCFFSFSAEAIVDQLHLDQLHGDPKAEVNQIQVAHRLSNLSLSMHLDWMRRAIEQNHIINKLCPCLHRLHTTLTRQD